MILSLCLVHPIWQHPGLVVHSTTVTHIHYIHQSMIGISQIVLGKIFYFLGVFFGSHWFSRSDSSRELVACTHCSCVHHSCAASMWLRENIYSPIGVWLFRAARCQLWGLKSNGTKSCANVYINSICSSFLTYFGSNRYVLTLPYQLGIKIVK